MKCEVCGKTYKTILGLSRHLDTIHKYLKNDKEIYYDKFLKSDENEGLCSLCSTNKTTFITLARGYRKYCSKCLGPRKILDFIKLYGEEEGRKKFCKSKIQKNAKGRCSLNWYIKKYGKAEGEKKYQILCEKNSKSQINVHTLNWYVENYNGHGVSLYYDAVNKRKFSNSKIGLTEKYGEEKTKKILKSFGSTPETFIKKFGKKEGKSKWKEYCISLGTPVRREYFLEQANCNYDLADWLLKERQAVGRLDKFIERYGEEEGNRRWEVRQESWQTTIKSKTDEEIAEINANKSLALEVLIRRKGEEQGKRIYLKWIAALRKRHTKNWFTERYGEEEGNRRWKEKFRLQGCVSKESLKFFNTLIYWLEENNICSFNDLLVGLPGSNELPLYGEDRVYFYDFTILPYRIIIEYNGSHVHPNPYKLNKEGWNKWKHAYNKESAEKAFYFTDKKLENAENRGFCVLEVWDSDGEECSLKRCKNFILNRILNYEKKIKNKN